MKHSAKYQKGKRSSIDRGGTHYSLPNASKLPNAHLPKLNVYAPQISLRDGIICANGVGFQGSVSLLPQLSPLRVPYVGIFGKPLKRGIWNTAGRHSVLAIYLRFFSVFRCCLPPFFCWQAATISAYKCTPRAVAYSRNLRKKASSRVQSGHRKTPLSRYFKVSRTVVRWPRSLPPL